MAISKIILNGVTQMDVTQDTVASSNLLSGYTATKNDGTKITGSYIPSTPTLQTKSVSYTPTESSQSQTVIADSGYDGLDEVNISVGAISSTYVGSGITRRSSSDLTNSLPSGVYRFIVPAGYYAEQATKDIAKYDLPTPTISIDNSTGVITATSFLGNAGYINTGTKTTTEQLTLRDSDDLTVSGATVTAPSGYYSASASKSVASGTQGLPSWSTSKGATTFAVAVSYPNATEGYYRSIDTGTYSMLLENKTVTPSTSQQVITPTSNVHYLNSVTVDAMPSGTAGTPTATKGTVSNHSVSVTPSVTNTTGYITGGTKTGTAVTVSASELVSGTKSITSNGSSDVTNYASVNVNVESEDFVITMSYNSTSELWEPDCTYAEAYSAYTANKNIVAKANNFTPVYIEYNTNEEAFIYRISEPWDDQSGYTWGFYDKVYIWASSGITVEDDQTYYSISSGNAVPSDVANGKVFFNAQGVQIGTATVSSEIQVAVATPQSGANSYLQFGNVLGNPISFSLIYTNDMSIEASYDKVSALTFDGTNYVGQIVTDTSNANASYLATGFSHEYYSNDHGIIVNSTNATFDAYSNYALIYTYGGSASDIQTADVQVGSGATSITFPVNGRPKYWSCVFKSNFGTSSGYQRVIAVANNGTNTYGLCLDSSAHASNSYWTANYSGGNFTISSQSTNAGGYFHQPGYYQLTYIVDESAPSYQSKTVTPTTSQQIVTADNGYDALSQVTVNAMPTGVATSATTISGTAATVSTGTNTLTLTKTVSNTPRITTAGYISTGTAGNSSVTLTANVTTKAAATITPGTTNQTIAAGTYLTGTQTIAGDSDLVGGNILSTANIFGVQGTVVVQNYYTGSSAPSSSLGQNGDIYIQQ